VAPPVEYNLTSQVGVMVGAQWIAAGRNASASITPAVRSTLCSEARA